MNRLNPFATVRGILIPASWTSSGVVTGLAVAAFDEMEYRLAEDDQMDVWKDCMNQVVIVSGFSYVKDGARWIDVQSFKKADER